VLLAGMFELSMSAEDQRTAVRTLVDAASTSSHQPDSRASRYVIAVAHEPSLR
jgi:hypothetical protein